LSVTGFCPILNGNQTVSHGENNQTYGISGTGLFKEHGAVPFNGSLADIQNTGYFQVGMTLADQLEHFSLPEG